MSDTIYLGVWINWSRGSILGQTLTTTKFNGNLLIAFTAFYIAFVATRFWSIICFLHDYYSTQQPRSTVHHQRQVILRNSSSPESGLASLLQLLWAWKNHEGPVTVILFPLILVTTCLLSFTVAGVFSSSISSSSGEEVLIKNANCGFIPSGWDNLAPYYASNGRKLTDATNYAQQCYGTKSSSILGCDTFVSAHLPIENINTSYECPFKGDICRSSDSNIRLDTGFIDSNDHLGINTRNSERFAYRYVVTCAPLETEGYTSEYTVINETWVRYHYGTFTVPDGTNQTTTDYIHVAPGVESQYNLPPFSPGAGNNYKLSAVYVYTVDGEPDYSDSNLIIPELRRPDGDVLVIFLSGMGVLFNQKMDDNWYRANTVQGTAKLGNYVEELKIYRPDDAASPMGCVEQWQWCNSAYPRESGCGPLASNKDAISGAAPLFNLSPQDLEVDRPSSDGVRQSNFIWSLLTKKMNPVRLPDLLGFLGAKSLSSQDRLYGGIQWSLPKNQWQLDVTQWFETVLASLQAAYVNTATGKYALEAGDTRLGPLNKYERSLCDNQKIRSTAYASFSLFGLYFTFILGGIVILFSYVIQPVQAFLDRNFGYRSYAYLEWTANSNMQLHRLAHEDSGAKKWTRCTGAVPTTTPDTNLAQLNITDPTHPILGLAPWVSYNTREGTL
ncbi:hypothetical protein F5Y08DRAFT_351646 [Xylaria arbuscula]|nr:hypothetical protein F5Y08DRAFT_351646 [Xylaria arbuscula]